MMREYERLQEERAKILQERDLLK
jgi:hypothetical protein